ncbi:hypothetical protein CHLNCDRAFT_20260, partial [Chlorella variabilis]
SKTMTREVVTISLANYEERQQEIAQQLYRAAKDVGFFYISDHGIPQEEVDHAFATGKSFLELDKETKAHYPFNPDTYLGWRGPDELETVTGGRAPPRRRPCAAGDDFRNTALAFQAKTHDVAVKILKALFLGLGWDPARIDDVSTRTERAAQNTSSLGSLSLRGHAAVPPRLHAHADMDVLTILFQRDDAVGLEIAPGNEDVGNIWNHVPVAREWTPLDPKPGHLTVNIGDGLTRWTDGVFKSTYHRVRAPKAGDPTGARYSIPYFVNPKLNYSIQGPNKRWGPVTGFDLLSKTGERSWAGGAGS